MGAGASISQNATTPLGFDPNVFPKLGVKLSYLDKFFEQCGGRQCLEGLTTTDVCELFVKPMTEESQSSFCDWLKYNKHAAVGIANVFISHAWKFKFLDVVDALVAHFKDKDNENVILWFDLFSNNQHKAVNLPFDYWSNTFKSAIDSFGHTVMVLSPWNDPIPLTRAWCLWELYCTVDTDSKFEIAMTQPSRNQFLEDILKDPKGEIDKMLGTINVERSECFKESDRDSIFEAIRSTIGFSKLNSLVFERFREWVIFSMEAEMTNDEENQRNPRYYRSLGVLYCEQGCYDKAEPHLELSYTLSLTLYGEIHLDTIKSINNLSLLYSHQERYHEAEILLEKGYQSCQDLLGLTHFETLMVMNTLGRCYYLQKKYYQSKELFEECYEKRKLQYGEINPETINTMNCLAVVYERLGKYEEAEEIFKRCYLLRKQILGETHPQSLQSMNNLAALYFDQGNYNQAEEIYQRCYELQRQILGETHPDTLISMSNLAALYEKQKKATQAEELFKRCYLIKKQKLGDTHHQTRTSMHQLASLYHRQKKYDQAEELRRMKEGSMG